jgi:hypothetical protein
MKTVLAQAVLLCADDLRLDAILKTTNAAAHFAKNAAKSAPTSDARLSAAATREAAMCKGLLRKLVHRFKAA